MVEATPAEEIGKCAMPVIFFCGAGNHHVAACIFAALGVDGLGIAAVLQSLHCFTAAARRAGSWLVARCSSS